MQMPKLVAMPAVWLAALAAAIAFAPETRGQDTVVLTDGRRISNVTVLRDHFDGVAVDRDRDGEEDEVFDPEQVVRVEYGDTPAAYRQAEIELRGRRLGRAAEQFRLTLAGDEPVDYRLVQYANFRLAETLRRMGRDDAALREEAKKAYREVVAAVPLGRLVPHSIRGLGQMLLEEGDAPAAEREFARLVREERFGTPWNLRGKLLVARAKGLQGQHEEGTALCDEVADTAQQAGLASIAAGAAQTRADVLLDAGQLEAAYEAFMEIARNADEKDGETLAFAYNGIGEALLGQGSPREALLAFLRVRVLYFEAAEELPRALYGAARGFAMLREGAKARELVALLQKDYPDSLWTAKIVEELGGG